MQEQRVEKLTDRRAVRLTKEREPLQEWLYTLGYKMFKHARPNRGFRCPAVSRFVQIDYGLHVEQSLS